MRATKSAELGGFGDCWWPCWGILPWLALRHRDLQFELTHDAPIQAETPMLRCVR